MCLKTHAKYVQFCRRQAKQAKEHRFLSPCPREHVIRAGLAIVATTTPVFLERAAAEQRSLFYTAAELRMSYQNVINNRFYQRRNEYELLLLFRQHQQKIHLATVQETANSSAYNHIFDFQRRGPPQRGHGNCCRFATSPTGVHQGALIYLDK